MQPLTGLKQMFEETTADVKSKVIRSVPFGDGKWSVLFYAQSGTDQVSSRHATCLNADRKLTEC